MRKNILVGQSGGPTAVINASLYGVITEGKAHPEHIDTVYGMVNGIEGFLSGRCMDLSQELTAEDLLLLKPVSYTHLDVYKRQTSYLSPRRSSTYSLNASSPRCSGCVSDCAWEIRMIRFPDVTEPQPVRPAATTAASIPAASFFMNFLTISHSFPFIR